MLIPISIKVKNAKKRRIVTYTKEFKEECVNLLKSGVSALALAKQTGVSRPTLAKWQKDHQKESLSIENAIKFTKQKIEELSKKININQGHPTSGALIERGASGLASSDNSDDVVMLSELISALAKLENGVKKIKSIKDKPRPMLNLSSPVASELKKRILEKGNLYGYQKEFLQSDDSFRIVLKSRQIGFSYVSSADALIGAVAGRNQLFLSASEEQALILMRYLRKWASEFGVEFAKDSEHEITLPNGAIIKALAHNFRTVQGFTGDIWMDEFAWYPNPKKIWHAFVPSIGAIKGRLTILSTPFEERSLFHELYSDESKYYMFKRFCVSIYSAIEDGLDFDLETMRNLFDADTWASAYECQFVDDESSLLSIALIKSCVYDKASYYTPKSNQVIYAGYDIGRVSDRSTLAGVVLEDVTNRARGQRSLSQGGRYIVAMMDVLAKAKFDEQKEHLTSFLKTYPLSVLKIDKTGIGMNLAENIHDKFRSRVSGVWFSNTRKEEMALNLKKAFEDKLISIPNDPLLIADIHAIKRTIGAKSLNTMPNATNTDTQIGFGL
ncbi:terminase domain protein [Campylobacter fetus subsp. venerealis cfvi03/293]|nr:terminase domain protein [Campylobacter fetus subsp. venerealis cfvi03/293]